MNGDMMYELAKQRMADQRRAARDAGQARAARAAARERRAKAASAARVAVPAIPDFAHEMFDEAHDGPARSGR